MTKFDNLEARNARQAAAIYFTFSPTSWPLRSTGRISSDLAQYISLLRMKHRE